MTDRLKGAPEAREEQHGESEAHAHSYPILSKQDYKDALYDLQVELVKLQRRLIKESERVLVIVEGRDAAGKDGLIKRLTAHMAPRETRIVALGKPSDRETSQWYFQRWTEHLPAAGEFVVFNRSWYNRAGVERVMGFCTQAELETFMTSVGTFEAMLIEAGITLFKYYLDISKDEQKKRLQERITDPLTQWKVSEIDRAAPKHWSDYSDARNDMFARTSTNIAPWHIVRADHKKTARIALVRDLLSRLEFAGRNKELCTPDPRIVFPYTPAALESGAISP